jgi:hypothetical protein
MFADADRLTDVPRANPNARAETADRRFLAQQSATAAPPDARSPRLQQPTACTFSERTFI